MVEDLSASPLPSRRQIRVAQTGQITMPGHEPQSRRERKLLERHSETGAIPPLDTPYVPGLTSPAPSVAPAEPTVAPAAGRPPAPPEPRATVSVPAHSVAAPPTHPEPPAAPLSRRQLREQLRQPATDAMPAPSTTASVSTPPVPLATEAIPAPAPVSPQILDQSRRSMRPPVVDVPPNQQSAPASPLPPVFAPPATTVGDAQLAQARTVGPAAPATNALILPVAPPMDVTGPLGDTGEVLITGNIPLPKHVAETGITGVIDTDLDDDVDFVGAESVYTQPVRAVQAVSSRSLELDAPMIKRPRWGAVSLALGISAAVLGVTAVSLLALALLTDIVQIPL